MNSVMHVWLQSLRYNKIIKKKTYARVNVFLQLRQKLVIICVCLGLYVCAELGKLFFLKYGNCGGCMLECVEYYIRIECIYGGFALA